MGWPAFFGMVRLAGLLIMFNFGALDSPTYFIQKHWKKGDRVAKNSIKNTENAKESLGTLDSAKGSVIDQFPPVVREKLEFWFSRVYVEEDVQPKIEQTLRDFLKIQEKQSPNFKAILSKQYGFRFFVACAVNILSQLSGINFLIFYSTSIFDKISGNGAFMSLVIAVSNICGAVVGLFTIEKFGRRFNLMYGSLVMAICFGILVTGITLSSKIMTTLSVVCYMICFAVSLGGTMPIFVAEIIPAVGVGISASVQWLTAALIGKLVPLVPFGPRITLSFFIFCLIFTALFANYACIETKGLTEREVEEVYKGGQSDSGYRHHFSWFKFGSGGKRKRDD